MNRENNTGVLPPEGEESAEFENVNTGLNNAEPVLESTEGSTPLGNANVNANVNANANIVETALEVPPNSLNVEAATAAPAPTLTVGKAKKPQSAKQQGTMAAQAEERASLKSAGVAKPSVAMVATLASMRAKGDAKYNSAFANAVAGKPLNSYRAPKTQKKGKKNATVTNTTANPAGLFSRNALNAVNTSTRVTAKNKNKNKNKKSKGVNSSTQASTRATAVASQTNMRNRNIVNSQGLNATIDAVLGMAESIGKQMAEMKRLIKTLKAKRPSAPRTSRAKKANRNNTSGNNSLLGLPPLPPAPTELNTGLSMIPEATYEGNNDNNAYTPPP